MIALYIFIGFMVRLCRTLAGNGDGAALSVTKAVFWPALLVVFLGNGVVERIS